MLVLLIPAAVNHLCECSVMSKALELRLRYQERHGWFGDSFGDRVGNRETSGSGCVRWVEWTGRCRLCRVWEERTVVTDCLVQHEVVKLIVLYLVSARVVAIEMPDVRGG